MNPFAARRRRFLEAMEPGSVAVFPTAHEIRRSNDTEFPFRPDSDFFYLTGFDEPDAVAVLQKGRGVPFTLFVRPRDKERETWTGRRAGPEGAIERYGADEAFSIGQLDGKMSQILENATTVYFHLGRYSDADGRFVGWLNGVRAKPRQALPPRRILDPMATLGEMRLFKTEEDLPLLRRAVAVSAEAHREAMAVARPGMREYEIQAVVEYVFRRRGAQAPGYNTIVGAGANATVLHYVTNRDPLPDGALLLLDAGAEVDGYTGDITRTYPVNGRFTAAQRALYEAVLEAQARAIAATKPGATILGIHEIATRALVEGMVANRLLEGTVDGNLESEAYKRFYMHRTSHWLGMDVHDVGDYLAGGESRRLEPGMVITIEPGLYVPPDEKLPSAADPAFSGMGIRIEDDVLVTPTGHEILSRDCPKEVADVEREMARSSIFA